MVTVGPSVNVMNWIASQSRREKPENVDGLFERTIEWGHDSLQEFVWFVFHVQDISRVCLAQLTRHRVATYNVQSSRHCVPSGIHLPESLTGNADVVDLVSHAVDVYDRLTKVEFVNDKLTNVGGIALEDARYIFPQAQTVNLFVGMNGRSLRNFLKLRLSDSAQAEIRDLAGEILAIVRDVYPTLAIGLTDE